MKRENRILKTAERAIYWHGTSSTFLRDILKKGLDPNPKKRVFDDTDENRTRQTFSMKSYGGAYITKSANRSQPFASGARRKFGGNNLYVGLTFESRTPSALLDEDDVISKLSNASLLRMTGDFGDYQNWLGPILREHNLSANWRDFRFDEYAKVAELIDTHESAVDVAQKFIDALGEQRPEVRKQFRNSKNAAQILDLATEMVRAFALHLLERRWKGYNTRAIPDTEKRVQDVLDDITRKTDNNEEPEPWRYEGLTKYREELAFLKSGKLPSPKMEGVFERLRNATNTFSKKLKTLSNPVGGHWSTDRHAIRIQEPVGFSGKNKILLIVEAIERESKHKIKYSENYESPVRVVDFVVRYGSYDSPEFRALLNDNKQSWGGPYRVIDKGKVIETEFGEKKAPWPDDLWGPDTRVKEAAVEKTAYITNPIIKLKQYLTLPLAKKGEEAADDFPKAFTYYITDLIQERTHEPKPEIVEALVQFVRNEYEDYEFGEDVDDDFYEFVIESPRAWNLQIPEALLAGFAKVFIEDSRWEDDYDEYADKDDEAPVAGPPSWALLEYKTLIKNQWLIHFTNHADDVAKQGFRYGVNDFTRLALTTWTENDHRDKQGGYNFAFRLKDFHYMARSGNSWKYGKECVIFRASGILCRHTVPAFVLEAVITESQWMSCGFFLLTLLMLLQPALYFLSDTPILIAHHLWEILLMNSSSYFPSYILILVIHHLREKLGRYFLGMNILQLLFKVLFRFHFATIQPPQLLIVHYFQ